MASKVAEILAQMAQNAGQTALRRGALLGGTIAQAADVPAQYFADQDRKKLEDLHTAQVQQQLKLQGEQGARESTTFGQQQSAYARSLQKQEVLNKVIPLGFTDPSNPRKFDPGPPIQAAIAAGFPELEQNITATHAALAEKMTSGAPGSVMRNEAGQVVPGSQIPALPSTAGNEVEKRRIYAKQASGEPLTPAEEASLKGFAAEAGVNDTPTMVKTVVNGKNVEIPMTRAQIQEAARTEKTFPSQPPASVTVNAAAAATAGQPASAAEKAIANYMLPPISARSMQTPAGKAMMDRILTENPAYDASKFSVRAPTRKAFTTGTQGQQLTAMNTAIEHLDQLQAAADALKNGEFKPGNAAYQYLQETFGANMPTNYDTIKSMVDHEVEAVAAKGVPTVSGTAEQKALAGKSASPEQLKGYIDTLIPLMGSKVNALHYQYKQAMGATDPFDPLTPEAKSILTQRGFDPENVKAKTAATSTVPDLSNLPAGAGRTFNDGPFKGQTWTIGADGKPRKVS